MFRSSVGAVLVLVWLVIGAVAAGQRGYFGSTDPDCSAASTIIVTILAGPLNYVGLNPTLECELPQPSD